MGIRKAHLIVSINRAQRSRNILPLFDSANMEIIFEFTKRKAVFLRRFSCHKFIELQYRLQITINYIKVNRNIDHIC